MPVTRAQVDAQCAGLPGARLAVPPEELLSWKVGPKMFACFGDADGQAGVSVKCRDVETAQVLIDSGAARRAPYFHRSWIRFDFADSDPEEVAYRLTLSYDLVRASLAKADCEGLPERGSA